MAGDKGKESHGVAANVARERSASARPAAAPAPAMVSVKAEEAASRGKEVASGEPRAEGKKATGRYRALSALDVTRGGTPVRIEPGLLEEGSLTEPEVEEFQKHGVLKELSADEVKQAEEQAKAAEQQKAAEEKQRAVAARDAAQSRVDAAKAEIERLEGELKAAESRMKSAEAEAKEAKAEAK